jgi:hypothetical protein
VDVAVGDNNTNRDLSGYAQLDSKYNPHRIVALAASELIKVN